MKRLAHGSVVVAANSRIIARDSAIMVNAVLPPCAPPERRIAVIAAVIGKRLRSTGPRAFVQILGKLHFLKLLENLRHILVDYGQKPTGHTNSAFNAAC